MKYLSHPIVTVGASSCVNSVGGCPGPPGSALIMGYTQGYKYHLIESYPGVYGEPHQS